MNERLKNNIAILKQHNLTHEPIYHITDGKKHEVDLINEIVTDCEEIFNDEEQGLIVRLPCKVGDKVYHIVKEPFSDYVIDEETVYGFGDWGDGLGLRLRINSCSPSIKCFGDNLFLTRAEAEKKFKQLKGEK